MEPRRSDRLRIRRELDDSGNATYRLRTGLDRNYSPIAESLTDLEHIGEAKSESDRQRNTSRVPERSRGRSRYHSSRARRERGRSRVSSGRQLARSRTRDRDRARRSSVRRFSSLPRSGRKSRRESHERPVRHQSGRRSRSRDRRRRNQQYSLEPRVHSSGNIRRSVSGHREANPFRRRRGDSNGRSRSRRQQVTEDSKNPEVPTRCTEWSFPTNPNGTFARAMSAIACNAEAGAKGVFNLVSSGEDSFKEQVTQALALKLNLRTNQQANERSLLNLLKSKGLDGNLKQILQARAAVYGHQLEPS